MVPHFWSVTGFLSAASRCCSWFPKIASHNSVTCQLQKLSGDPHVNQKAILSGKSISDDPSVGQVTPVTPLIVTLCRDNGWWAVRGPAASMSTGDLSLKCAQFIEQTLLKRACLHERGTDISPSGEQLVGQKMLLQGSTGGNHLQ